jgi:hypothetical protein
MRRDRITKQSSRWLRHAIVETANTAKVRDKGSKHFTIALREGDLRRKELQTGKEMLVKEQNLRTFLAPSPIGAPQYFKF